MKRLLRSVIDFQDDQTDDENRSVNYQRLAASGYEWSRPEDQKIWAFVQEFFQERLDLPTARTVTDFFGASNDEEVLERMKAVEAAAVYKRSNFAHLLKTLWEDQNRIKMLALFKEGEEVVSKGLIIGEGKNKKRIQGITDAYQHFTRQAHDLIPQELNIRMQGDIRTDTDASWEEYQEAKHNKGKAWGNFCGLNHIDSVIRGLKAGELWIHAGAPGHLKTMFALNWAYNLVTRYKRNIVYFTLEVQYHHVRRILAALHSAHPKFRLQGYSPLDYRKIRDGELTPEEEEFYQRVLKDWKECPDYCHFEVVAKTDVTVSDIRLETELLHKQFEVGQLFVDHSELVQPEKWDSSYTIRLNSIIRDMKKLGLLFNAGQGLPVCLLHQINREGEEYANKNDGRYRKRDLSYANEVEKSADVITTTYLNDEHRANGTTMCTNLKSRDNPHFDPVLLNVDFGCRRIHNLNPIDAPDMGSDEHDAVLDAMMEV